MDLSMKVLVVDDMAAMRRIVNNVLKKIGFTNIVEAEDGEIALTELKKDKIDLIISDWNMPNMNGLELLKIAREMDEYRDIPFLMVTAEGQKHNVIDAIHYLVSVSTIRCITHTDTYP